MTFSTALSPEDLELMDAQRLHAVITNPSNGAITRIAYDPDRLFMKLSNIVSGVEGSEGTKQTPFRKEQSF